MIFTASGMSSTIYKHNIMGVDDLMCLSYTSQCTSKHGVWLCFLNITHMQIKHPGFLHIPMPFAVALSTCTELYLNALNTWANRMFTSQQNHDLLHILKSDDVQICTSYQWMQMISRLFNGTYHSPSGREDTWPTRTSTYDIVTMSLDVLGKPLANVNCVSCWIHCTRFTAHVSAGTGLHARVA